MKRIILFTIMLTVLTIHIAWAGNDPVANPQTPPPVPDALVSLLTIPTIIYDLELTVDFNTPVGEAIITVYDAIGQVTDQEKVDTSSTPYINIPTNNWSAGYYTVTLSYDDSVLARDFTIEY